MSAIRAARLAPSLEVVRPSDYLCVCMVREVLLESPRGECRRGELLRQAGERAENATLQQLHKAVRIMVGYGDVLLEGQTGPQQLVRWDTSTEPLSIFAPWVYDPPGLRQGPVPQRVLDYAATARARALAVPRQAARPAPSDPPRESGPAQLRAILSKATTDRYSAIAWAYQRLDEGEGRERALARQLKEERARIRDLKAVMKALSHDDPEERADALGKMSHTKARHALQEPLFGETP